ncbi:hypothetical protein [Meiothermus sp.]|uniref:hypothetical protein n=1 Tax=Meiothermus sp. TaxID=1955249 RepID=UPI002614A013|nr:hypothetical protein [Meiothermus sp.]
MLPTPLAGLQVGHRVFMDEGKLEARVEQVEPQAVLLRVVGTPPRASNCNPRRA